LTPLVKMHTLGHNFIPDPIHAGGLRYHGMAPLVSCNSHTHTTPLTHLPGTAEHYMQYVGT